MINYGRYFVIIAFATWATYSQAVPIVYDVNLAIGSGNVSGTITTDGTEGILVSSNITAWSVTIFDGVDSTSLVSGDGSTVAMFDLLRATASALILDFSGAADGYFSMHKFTANDAPFTRFFAAVEYDDALNAGMQLLHTTSSSDPGHQQYEGVSSTDKVQFATAATAAVPVPATLALFGLGLAGLGISRRKRQTHG